MPDCCSKILKTTFKILKITYLRECPGNNTPNLPHREALDAAEMHQYDTIRVLYRPMWFFVFLLCEVIKYMRLARLTPGQRKGDKSKVL